MVKAGALEIGQAFYGSFSGDQDYRILAASSPAGSGFSREERELVSLRSNLGGSAQTAPSFPTFFTFYKLGRERRWAFSRTVWLGRGSRGNDYLAHVLALDSEVMKALRGDPFLLRELFRDEKPPDERKLQPLYAPLGEMEEQAIRPCGSALDPRIEGALAAAFLRTIARGALSVQLEDGEAAASLCRSIVSLLLPEDREGLSFCSRFSLPRRTSFRLAAYAAEDASLAARYLDGFNTEVAAGSRDSWSEWVAACRQREIDPFYRCSLAENTASGMLEIIGKFAQGDLSDRRLKAIVDEPLNQRFGRIQQLTLPLAWKDVEERAAQVVSAGGGIALLEESCRQAWLHDPDGRFFEKKIAAASRQGVGSGSISKATAVLAMAVLVPAQARPQQVLVSGSAVFQPGEAAGWILALNRENRDACRTLLTAWFIAWFRSDGPAILQPVLKELQQLKGRGGTASSAAFTAFHALWDVKPGYEDERVAWRAELLHQGREQLGSALLPDRDIGRLVLQGRHLVHMPDGEARSLLNVTCVEFPSETEAWLEREEPPTRLLLLAAKACDAGLGAPDDPRCWSLVGRIADALVRRSKAEPPERLEDGSTLTSLLFSAALASPAGAVARIASAVKAATGAMLPGGADLLPRAAVLLACKGDRTAARAVASAGPRLKAQGEWDFFREGSSDEVWGSFLLEAAWRNVETYAQEEG